jgi:uncharacterized protein
MDNYCAACGKPLTQGSLFCAHCGTRMAPFLEKEAPQTGLVQNASTENDRLLILFSHLGGVFLGFVPALMVFFLKKDTPGGVLENAKEALNWQLSLTVYCIVAYLLSYILIGKLIFPVLLLTNAVLCVWAAMKSGVSSVYRYPFTIPLMKK